MSELKVNFIIDNLNKVKKSLENINVGKSTGDQAVAGNAKGGGKGLLGITAALGGIVALLGGLLTSTESIVSLIKIVGSILNALVAPFIPILVGLLKPVLVLLQVLIGFMLNFYKDPIGALQGLFEGLAGLGGKILGLSPEEINSLLTGIRNSFTKIRDVFSSISEFMSAFFKGDYIKAFNILKDDVLPKTFEILKGIFMFGWNILKSILSSVWDSLSEIFLNRWEQLKDLLSGAWNGLKDLFSKSWEIFKSVMKDSWTGLVNIFNETWTFIKGLFQKAVIGLASVWDFLINNLSKGIKSFANLFIKGLNSIIDLINKVPGITKIGRISSIDTTTKTSDIAGYFQKQFEDKKPSQTNINVNIEGSADQKTVESVVLRLRQELSRRGAF